MVHNYDAREILEGVIVPICTFFKPGLPLPEKLELVNDQISMGIEGLTNKIDYKRTFEHIENLYKIGVRKFLVAATTGQSAVFREEEQVKFVRGVYRFLCKNYNYGKDVFLLAGAGSNTTFTALELTLAIQGIDPSIPCLHITGYYNKPTAEGQEKHFRSLSKYAPGPLVIYECVGRAPPLDENMIVNVAELPNIIGIKYSNEKDPEKARRIIERTRGKNFELTSGDCGKTAEYMKLGCVGVISATANIPKAAELFIELVNAGLNKNFDEADRIQKELEPYVEYAFSRTNPIPAAYYLGTGGRLPLLNGMNLHASDEEKVRKSLDAILKSSPFLPVLS